MPQFVDATNWDREIVRRQIGREPRGMVGVSRRCGHGCPQVVVTEPIHASGSPEVVELFPTMFWLSCPCLCKSVAALESEQWIERFRARVNDDAEFARRLEMRHRQYASERASLAGPGDLRRLCEAHPHRYRRLTEPGIGGIERTGGIKCLHLHLADYLSGGDNPVGEEVCRMLSESGRPVECDEGACRQRSEAVAIVNVGSNSAKLLVARMAERVDEGLELETVTKQVRVTRLAERIPGSAEGSLLECRLASEAVERTVEAVAGLAAEARSRGVSMLKVFGTAAVRRAGNRDDLVLAISDRTGLELSTISSRQEAELSFEGACRALRGVSRRGPASDRVSVIDIGGASTEVAVGRCREELRSASIELGALTSLARFADSFDVDGRLPATCLSDLLGYCRQAVLPALQSLLKETQKVVAVGGSVTAATALLLGLKSYEPEAIHGYELSRSETHELLTRLCQHTRHERLAMRGMISGGRVDSVIGGTAILVSLMDVAHVDCVCVSEHGFLEGMAWRLLERCCEPRRHG